jgi:hypothetical protein
MATRSGLAGWLHRLSDSDVWWSFKSSPMTVSAAAVTGNPALVANLPSISAA